SKNNLVTDNVFNKQSLGKIPATAMQFYDRYYIETEQLSLSPEAYDFWRLVEKQQTGSTDLFQPNAIKIKGNMESTSNPGETVLGFFNVSGIVSKSLFIDKSEVPFTLPEIEIIPFSCVKFYYNSTDVK